MISTVRSAGEFWMEYTNLKRDGWIEIRIPVHTVETDEIRKWLSRAGITQVLGAGQYWVFKNPVDATMFRLTWL
jgi:hypothetical protein